MKLTRKTELYSIGLCTFILALIVSYFIFLFPSLYVDYRIRRNYDVVERALQKCINQDTGECKLPKDSKYMYLVQVPYEKNAPVTLNCQWFTAKIEIMNEDLKEQLEIVKSIGRHVEDHSFKESEIKQIDLDRIKHIFTEEINYSEFPLRISFQDPVEDENYKLEQKKLHEIADNAFIFEGTVSDGINYYTNNIAIASKEDSFVLIFQTNLTPKISEVKPILLQSLPMMIAVTIILVLFFSRLYSNQIVRPIQLLSSYARNRRFQGKENISQKMGVVERVECKNEITSLSNTLNELFERLDENYHELEHKNEQLEEENERQEVFLRASSHQLKTPIAASLLLLEGMMAEIGKYADTKRYLPKVKEQIISMQKIVEDIMYINHCSQHMEKVVLDFTSILENVMHRYQFAIEEQKLQIESKIEKISIISNEELLTHLVENIFSNAVHHTPKEGKIVVELTNKELVITNYGTQIATDILPHIYEPFVTSSDAKGHGLGLYVAAYCSKYLDYSIHIDNIDNGVRAELRFIERA